MKMDRKARTIVVILTAGVVVLGLALGATVYGLARARSDLSDLQKDYDAIRDDLSDLQGDYGNVVRERDQLQETLSDVRSELERVGVPSPALPGADDLLGPENWVGYWRSVSDSPEALADVGFPFDFSPPGFEGASKAEFFAVEPPFSTLVFAVAGFSSAGEVENAFAACENWIAGSPGENAYAVSVGDESIGVTRGWFPRVSVIFRVENAIGAVGMGGENVEKGDVLPYAKLLSERISKFEFPA